MLESCPECGESELAWDSYAYSQGEEGGQCVCQNCGAVVAVNDLTSDEPRHTTAGVCSGQPSTALERKAFAIRSQNPQVSKGRRSGLQFAARIAQCLECKPSMTAEAVGLFERFYKHELYLRRATLAKQMLAGCCVYIVCRRRSWPVTLTDLSSFIGCDVYELQGLKNELLANFDDLSDIRPPDLSELVEAHCSRAGFSNNVHDTLIKIIQMCRDLWISEGRRPDTVIAAASYVAWQTEDPKSRVLAPIRSFCETHRIVCTTKTSAVVKEIKSTLCQLGVQIPWIAADSLNIKNIIWNVSEVLQYRCSLEADARTSFRQELLAITEQSTLNSSLEPEDVKDSFTNETDVASGSMKVIVNNDRISSSGYKVSRVHEPFLPESYVNPRKKIKRTHLEVEGDECPYHPDLDAVELGDYDIRDEDMCLYVKSVEEQQNSNCEFN